MIITYLRSSSVGSFNWCQHKYFIEYVLGKKDVGGKKAEMGSTVHKVLEILAREKLALQNGQTKFLEEETGTEWESPVSVERALDVSFDYYESKSAHTWTDEDWDTCLGWVNSVLEYDGGLFDPRNRKIILPEQYFDLEMPYDWAKYEYEDPHNPSKRIQGRLRIKGTMDLITELDDGMIEYIDWKGLPVETKIPTISGWSTMGDLKVGDIIFDKDGLPTRVVGKSQVKNKECYKITFDDSTSVICDDEHLWYMTDKSVKPITELKVGDKIDVAKPLQLPDIKLPIDPYVLGVWLGNALNTNREIFCIDDFIINEIKNRGYYVENNKYDSRFKMIVGLIGELKAIQLMDHNRHIPEIYLRSSEAQRLDLLRGLMDTSGMIYTHAKKCSYIHYDTRLINNIMSLLLSLGQKVTKKYDEKTAIYSLFFRPVGINPFLYPNNKDKIVNWEPKRSSRRLITQIEKLTEKMQTQCISVDSSTSTYLCTENMIPTHNTGQRKNWETGKVKDQDDLTKDFQMRLYHYALCQLYPDKDVMMTIFFVRSGGPFTLMLDRSNIPETIEMIKNSFETIKKNKFPSRVLDYDRNSFKCRLLCGFYQDFCEKARTELVELGINKVVAKYSKPGVWSNYGDGGGRTGENK